jgi:hypothetical protein
MVANRIMFLNGFMDIAKADIKLSVFHASYGVGELE